MQRVGKKLSRYNITKFILLKQIISIYLIKDLLKAIIDYG